MKQIIKTVPPEEFVEYCKTPGSSFSELSGKPKKALKERLLEDQGYICCYCGTEIHNNEQTKIEHIKCQKRHDYLSLCFDNMLASCDGGDKDRMNKVKPKHQLHCDAKKGNDDIPISPLNYVDDLLVYFDDGTVKGRNNVGQELIRILGLNVKYLVSQRKNAIESYNDLPLEDLEKELVYVDEKQDGEYMEYCFVLKQYLMNLVKEKEHNLMGAI